MAATRRRCAIIHVLEGVVFIFAGTVGIILGPHVAPGAPGNAMRWALGPVLTAGGILLLTGSVA